MEGLNFQGRVPGTFINNVLLLLRSPSPSSFFTHTLNCDCSAVREEKDNSKKIPGGHSMHPCPPLEEELKNVPSGQGRNVR